jgi:hypothetical protein
MGMSEPWLCFTVDKLDAMNNWHISVYKAETKYFMDSTVLNFGAYQFFSTK